MITGCCQGLLPQLCCLPEQLRCHRDVLSSSQHIVLSPGVEPGPDCLQPQVVCPSLVTCCLFWVALRKRCAWPAQRCAGLGVTSRHNLAAGVVKRIQKWGVLPARGNAQHKGCCSSMHIISQKQAPLRLLTKLHEHWTGNSLRLQQLTWSLCLLKADSAASLH